MYFKKRILEPEFMTKSEIKAFENIANKKSKIWNSLIIDHVFNKNFKPFNNMKILDVGCGLALLIKDIYYKFHKFKPEIIGLDKFKKNLDTARKNISNLKNYIHIVKGDVHNLRFPSNYFDLIICKDSLHHFKNVKKALKEMHRILNKNGLIYIQDLRRDCPFYILKTILPPDTPEKKIIFNSVRSSYTINEIKKILNQLKIIKYKIGVRKMTKHIELKYRILDPDINSLRSTLRSRFFLMIKK